MAPDNNGVNFFSLAKILRTKKWYDISHMRYFFSTFGACDSRCKHACMTAVIVRLLIDTRSRVMVGMMTNMLQ